jgi:hypothetical protein
MGKKTSTKKPVHSKSLAGAKPKGLLSSLFNISKTKKLKKKESYSDTEPLLGKDQTEEKPKKVVSRTLAVLLNPEQVPTAHSTAPRRSKRKAERELEKGKRR